MLAVGGMSGYCSSSDFQMRWKLSRLWWMGRSLRLMELVVRARDGACLRLVGASEIRVSIIQELEVCLGLGSGDIQDQR